MGEPPPVDRHLTWKRAQNAQVVAIAEAAFAGRLDDFQFDLESFRIYGWRIKGGGVWPTSGAVAARHLRRIGRDVALVEREADVVWGSGGRKAQEGRAWASAYRGTQAISRRGRSLGAVQDFVIEADGRRVTGLILHGDRLLRLDGRVHAGPSAVVAESEELLVELGNRDEDPDGVRWWQRLMEALGVREERPAGEGRLAEVPATSLPLEEEDEEEAPRGAEGPRPAEPAKGEADPDDDDGRVEPIPR